MGTSVTRPNLNKELMLQFVVTIVVTNTTNTNNNVAAVANVCVAIRGGVLDLGIVVLVFPFPFVSNLSFLLAYLVK